MKKRAAKEYFKTQWEDMVFHFKAFVKNGEQEELHQFRVQVKKIRAMLILLDIASPKSKLAKYLKPVRRIFKHVGDVRNAYINLKLGVHYKLANQEFIDKQVYIIENGTFEIKKLGKAYLKIMSTVRKEIEEDLIAPSDEQISEFYKMQLEHVTVALTDLQFNDGLHDTRKQIKILIYNRKLAHSALEGKLHINIDHLDKLQEAIGDWHDNIQATELFSSPEVDDKALTAKLKRRNNRLKRAISTLADDLWKKVVLINEPEVEIRLR